eukprot:5374560-Pleurochrysis_carterae.AAC.1
MEMGRRADSGRLVAAGAKVAATEAAEEVALVDMGAREDGVETVVEVAEAVKEGTGGVAEAKSEVASAVALEEVSAAARTAGKMEVGAEEGMGAAAAAAAAVGGLKSKSP